MIIVDTREVDGWQVISVSGEIDVVSAPSIRGEVVTLVTRGFTAIVLDFAQVDFIDSFGLGVMVGALKRVKSHDGQLRVVINEARVLAVLELTGVDQVFELYDSLAAALEGDSKFSDEERDR